LIKVTLSVSSTSSSAAIADVTQGWTGSLSGPGGSNLVSVGFGVAPFLSGVPVYAFGKLRIFNAAIDRVTPRAARSVAVNMKTTTGTLQVRTHAFNTAANAWAEVWKHS
jgi:hypothetical protein